MIRGTTKLIPLFGSPTTTVKAPMIYNPWFERHEIDAVVVPVECSVEDYPELLRLFFRLSNIAGALVTMPHKVTTCDLVDRVSSRAEVAGAVNAVRLAADGALEGDMFDGEGFVAGMAAHGISPEGRSALVIGAGGVGSAIAASLAKSGIGRLALYDLNEVSRENLSSRLSRSFPKVALGVGSPDPAGYDIVINASPLGMRAGDPLPVDVSRLSSATFVGEVVMKSEITPFLAAAKALGCLCQVGTDMLFEQVPSYLEFFGYPRAPVAELRQDAAIRY